MGKDHHRRDLAIKNHILVPRLVFTAGSKVPWRQQKIRLHHKRAGQYAMFPFLERIMERGGKRTTARVGDRAPTNQLIQRRACNRKTTTMTTNVDRRELEG